MQNSIVDFINEEIKIHGTNQYGDPIFRVVFSDDQLEKRYISLFNAIMEVKKYPWIRSKWILERWAPGELSYHSSLFTDKDGVYICVYTFQDANRNYLPPLLKVCEIVIKHLLNPRSKSQALAEDRIKEEMEDKLEVEKIETELKVQSDEHATKDRKSQRESSGVGYTKKELK